METLSVGMYVRKKNGRIGRIKEIDERDNVQLWYLLDIKNSNFDVKCEGKHIKKASHNIIDLIEVGDYVNGYKVYYCYCADEDMTGLFIDTETKRVWLDKSSQIKSIVTKEQFEQMQYKVGE